MTADQTMDAPVAELVEVLRVIRNGYKCEHWPIFDGRCVCEKMDELLGYRPTYAEKQLQPLGFKVVSREQSKRPAGEAVKVVMQWQGRMFEFACNCPFYPDVRSLGCPLHHNGIGDSGPVVDAARVAQA